MRRLFDSGAAFMVVALVCIAAGVTADNGTVLVGLGAFWLILAIMVRAKYAKKLKSADHSKST